MFPIQRLPTELLAQTFVECLPCDPYLEPSPSEPPLLLTRVCRRWRQVALHTCELWCSLNAIEPYSELLPTYSEELQPIPSELISHYATWLSRSGSRPLSLKTSFPTTTTGDDDWLGFLLSHRERFQRLRILTDDVDFNFSPLLDYAPLLQHLVVQLPFGDSDHALSITPPKHSLRTLVLDGTYLTPACLSASGWANLTRIAVRPSLDPVPLDQVLLLLDSCPKCEALVFGPVTANSPYPPSRSYPNLRSLFIAFEGLVDDAISTLHLPGLVDLRLLPEFQDLEVHLEGPGRELASAVDATQSHRLCNMVVVGAGGGIGIFDLGWVNITSLEVEICHNETNMFHTLLSVCPNLQELFLRGTDCGVASTSFPAPFAHNSLLSLTVAAWPQLGNLLQMATLPKLQHLTIFCIAYGEHDDIHAFLYRSRCPLETLVLRARNSTFWTEEERAALTQLIPTLSHVALT